MRAFRLGLLALAAAAGGSALGAALLTLPAILIRSTAFDAFATGLIFIVSLPFTLAGSAGLTGLSLLLQNSLSDRFGDYFGIVLASAPVGAAMTLPVFGGAGLFFGALFALLTAAVWALLYIRLALPPELRELGRG